MTLRPTHQHTRASQYRRPGGPWDVPTLDDLLTEAGRATGAASVALVDGGVRLSFSDVDRLAGRLAGGLHDAGVRRRDAVAWQLPNGYESVLLFRACWRIGAVAVPIHERAGAADVERMLDGVEPAITIGATNLPLGSWPKAYVIGGSALPARSHSGSTGVPVSAPHHDTLDFASLLNADPVETDTARPSDLAAVLFTAGSTGVPKGVLHTHRTLAYKARRMPEVHGLDQHDAVLMPAPLGHISGLLNGILVPGVTGMKSVLMSRWNTDAALDAIEDERITFMVGPPTFFFGLMEARSFSSRRVRTLRLVSSGGTGVSPSFVRRAEAALGAQVKRTYGSTEAPSVVTSGGDDDRPERPEDNDSSGEDDSAELRVVDPETGTDQPPGREGELWLRGPELCVGYLDPAHTEAAFARGGWFRTGDLAIIDPELGLSITGRLKDIVIRGGENISVSEIEEILERHPDVRAAAVIGFPDERLGERVAAFVIARGQFDLDECRHWFAQQGIAKYKWPEHVQSVLSMPTLASGKVDRHELRTYLH